MNVKSKQQSPKSKKDIFLWIIIVLVICAAIVANSYFSDVVWSLKLVGWIVVAAVEIFFVMLTSAGKALWTFTKESRMEMRKVVWPTRHETIRTTLIVSALVLVTALIMWGVDSMLLWIIGWLTGQRG
ncbi:MAG: preprotein translocase subunit SecE [Gammaproteobacteria bacterium]|nr:preprotein translocase subunit SecE [Gammaproteobacteria bacterium]